jgi:hypothetical protein
MRMTVSFAGTWSAADGGAKRHEQTLTKKKKERK